MLFTIFFVTSLYTLRKGARLVKKIERQEKRVSARQKDESIV
jgi:hypothetical protein